MSEFIVTEKQFKVINQKIELANENWNNFSDNQKEWIVEFLKKIYPEKAKLIKEAQWYNTLGDVIGLFDPTGVVDLVNGISYIYQGDNLFGLLSMISAVPYIGDVVAKPVMAALKIGAPSAKALEGVLKLSKAGKSVEATELLTKLTKQGGITGKFVNGFGKVSGKLRSYVERMPAGVFKGLKNTILQWFDLFEKAAKSGKSLRSQGQTLAKTLSAKGGARLSQKSIEQNLNFLISQAKKTPGIFTGYRTSKGVLSWKTLFRGVPQLMGRNASVRSLMRQTKWWLGFLDYIGFGNFVGPEEVMKKMGESNFVKKMEEYNNTPEAKDNYENDFGVEGEQPQPTQSNTPVQGKDETDPFASFLNKLFKNTINPLPI